MNPQLPGLSQRPPAADARLQTCLGWRKTGSKTLAVDQRLLQAHCPQRRHRKKLLLKLGSSGTHTHMHCQELCFLAHNHVSLADNKLKKNDPREERSMFNLSVKLVLIQLKVQLLLVSMMGSLHSQTQWFDTQDLHAVLYLYVILPQ